MSCRANAPAPSVAVIERVATRENIDPVRLDPPLHDVVDPDALDALCSGLPVEIAFSYCGYTVTVRADGSVDVADQGYEAGRPGRSSAAGVPSD